MDLDCWHTTKPRRIQCNAHALCRVYTAHFPHTACSEISVDHVHKRRLHRTLGIDVFPARAYILILRHSLCIYISLDCADRSEHHDIFFISPSLGRVHTLTCHHSLRSLSLLQICFLLGHGAYLPRVSIFFPSPCRLAALPLRRPQATAVTPTLRTMRSSGYLLLTTLTLSKPHNNEHRPTAPHQGLP